MPASALALGPFLRGDEVDLMTHLQRSGPPITPEVLSILTSAPPEVPTAPPIQQNQPVLSSHPADLTKLRKEMKNRYKAVQEEEAHE